MKKIIHSKRYDTDKAEMVAEHGNGRTWSDFRYCQETLYKTKEGTFFLHGEGGALSSWQESCGNGFQGGSDIRLFTRGAAREWLEEKRFTEALEREFGNEIVDG